MSKKIGIIAAVIVSSIVLALVLHALSKKKKPHVETTAARTTAARTTAARTTAARTTAASRSKIFIGPNGSRVEMMEAGASNPTTMISEGQSSTIRTYAADAFPEKIRYFDPMPSHIQGTQQYMSAVMFREEVEAASYVFVVDTATATSSEVAGAMNKIVDNIWVLPPLENLKFYDDATSMFTRPPLKMENGKMYALPPGAVNDTNIPYYEVSTTTTLMSRIAWTTAMYHLKHDMEKPVFVDIEVAGLTVGEIKNNLESMF